MPSVRTRTRIHRALLTLLLVPACASAQNASPSPCSGPASPGSGDHDQETISKLVEQIKQLQQQDHDLEERIKILESKLPQAVPASAPEAETASIPTPPLPPEPVPPPQAPSAVPRDWHDVRGIQWRGFGEVNYKALDQRKPELATYGFTPGSAGALYPRSPTTPLIAEDVRVYIETLHL